MELSTNVHFSEASNSRYQLLYSSQSYLTFYSIYGKFNIANGKVIDADFFLLNFKGMIKMGLVSVNFKGFENETVTNYLSTSRSPHSEIKCGVFDVLVKALHPSSLIKNVNINSSLGSFSDHYLSIRRKLNKIDKPNSGIFDTEFFYGDGLRAPYPYPEEFLDYRLNRVVDNENNNENGKSYKGPGGICPRGYAKVLF